jgi:glycosyltransferase involved in cell wall biosynthesis
MRTTPDPSFDFPDIAPAADQGGNGGNPDAPPLQRVLYVVSRFPSWSETFIVREIHALIEEGVDVRILSLKRGDETMVQADAAALRERVRQPSAGFAALAGGFRSALAHPRAVATVVAHLVAGLWRKPAVMLMSVGTVFRVLPELAWLERFDPRFIHAHWSTYPTTAAWALSRLAGRPFGFTCHAHDVFRNHHLLPRKIEEAALAVTISRHNVDWLDRNITPLAARKLEVVHCGVDLRQIPWQPGGRDAEGIVAVGRLSPEKGFHTLVEALALLHRDGVGFRCRIVGDGPARGALAALIDRHGLRGCVELAGAQPQEAVRAALASASVFALPCEVAANGSRDGIPVALMEAMASGCTVVSCPVSGVPELIGDGVHGLLANERDPGSLAEALRRLLGDAALRQRLATAARRRIEMEFDARREGTRLHGLMRRAAAHAA